jgi:hypothetical protein
VTLAAERHLPHRDAGAGAVAELADLGLSIGHFGRSKTRWASLASATPGDGWAENGDRLTPRLSCPPDRERRVVPTFLPGMTLLQETWHGCEPKRQRQLSSVIACLTAQGFKTCAVV